MEQQTHTTFTENESMFSPANTKLIWMAGIISGIIALSIKLNPHSWFYDQWSAYTFAGMLAETAVFWMIISRVFGTIQKAAVNALYVSLGVVLAQFILHKALNSQLADYEEIINLALAAIPATFFFNRLGKITGKPVVAIIALGALSIMPVVNMALPDIDLLFFRHSHMISIFFTLVKAVLMPMAVVFLKTEIIRQVLCYPGKEFKDTTLNLKQEYSKPQYLVLYFATRLALDIMAFRFIRVLTSGYYGDGQSTPLNYFPTVITWMITLLLLAWLHRKYLIEYLLTYNKVPSFLYWALMIPFVNLLIFLISYFFIRTRVEPEARKENLRHALSMNYYEHIGYIILLLQGISLFISVAKLDWSRIVTGGVAFFTFIYMIKGKTLAFYLLAGFNLALLFIMAFPGNHVKELDSDVYFAQPLVLVSIYLLYGIFYINKFSEEGVEDIHENHLTD